MHIIVILCRLVALRKVTRCGLEKVQMRVPYTLVGEPYGRTTRVNFLNKVTVLDQCLPTFVRPRPGKLFFPQDEGPVPTDLLVNTFPIFFKFIH